MTDLILCKCGHDEAAHRITDGICLVAECPCFGWWPPDSVGIDIDEHGNEVPAGPPPPRDIVAMSYGCTCPKDEWDPDMPHSSSCRIGQVTAVKVAAWQDVVERLRVAAATIGKLSAHIAILEQAARDFLAQSAGPVVHGSPWDEFERTHERLRDVLESPATTTRGAGQ